MGPRVHQALCAARRSSVGRLSGAPATRAIREVSIPENLPYPLAKVHKIRENPPMVSMSGLDLSFFKNKQEPVRYMGEHAVTICRDGDGARMEVEVKSV